MKLAPKPMDLATERPLRAAPEEPPRHPAEAPHERCRAA